MFVVFLTVLGLLRGCMGGGGLCLHQSPMQFLKLLFHSTISDLLIINTGIYQRFSTTAQHTNCKVS